MPNHYDVIIIGGGNAGLAAARVLAEANKRIAIIEPREFGGTCPNRGCTPKKVLVAAAGALDEISRAEAHGINVGSYHLDWARLIHRKQEMISGIPEALHQVARQRADVYRSDAQFVGPNAVLVDGCIMESDHIVVATGSRPRVPRLCGAEHLATSDDLLSMTSLPESVVFLGGGVIAFEFAHVLARAGARVTILEAQARPLAGFDEDAVDVLVAATARLGISVRCGVAAKSVAASARGFAISDGSQELAHGAMVVNGTGRTPDVDRLNLEAAGVRSSNGAIDVDDFLRAITNCSVWVCGDALASSPQLSPLATHEGTVVARNILDGAVHRPEHTVVPRSIFTIPTLSTVGITGAAAEASGGDTETRVTDLSTWLSARTHAESAAWAKIVVDRASDRILGAHLVGHRGEDLIHLFAMAMKHGISASAVAAGPFSFPTFSADLKNLF